MLTVDYPDPGLAQDFGYAVQLALGVVFTASVVPKLRRPRDFRRIVADYRIFQGAATAASGAVIIAEVGLAVSFLTGEAMAAALPVAFLLLAVFATATALNLRRGRDIDCGCFGRPDERISARSLTRLALLGVGVLGLIVGSVVGAVRPTTVGGLISQGSPSLVYVLLVTEFSVFAGCAATWLLHANRLRLLAAKALDQGAVS